MSSATMRLNKEEIDMLANALTCVDYVEGIDREDMKRYLRLHEKLERAKFTAEHLAGRTNGKS